jgi:hypothetical protein
MHRLSCLLEIHELLVLLPHHVGRGVVGAESTEELILWHLVVHGASGSVVGPPCTGIPTQLLRSKGGLLHFGVAQEPDLGLHHLKPVTGLKRLSCLNEERWVSGCEVTVGARSRSLFCPIATMISVGHELPQQLGLFIMGLKD